jgi:glycerol-3-phosphate O-acyltransferase / dihydroxyacetone phosphate acyltransferase
MALLTNIVARLVGWTAGIFYRVERIGGPLPDGPVLITANHPNSLLDPLLVFHAAERPARPLAKAPLFKQVFVGSMLRALGGLPVYRKQDDAALMHRNDETFRRAIEALVAGDTVQIFPEGKSHSEPAMAPLRTGAARIAVGAEAAANWQLGLSIVPIGITYRRKAIFRGQALVMIGTPFMITDLRELYDRDPQESARVLTDRISERLQQITLNLTNREDQELIETAEALYVREKGVSRSRERDPMHERLPRLQRFADGLAWLRANDPPRHDRLVVAVRRYRRFSQLLGAQEGDVPRRYDPGTVLGYVLREAPVLLIAAPLALIGNVLWYLPYKLPGIIVSRMKLDFEAIATYKLASAFFIWPISLALYVFIAWRFLGLGAAIAAAMAIPILGFIALAWRERWQRVREDARLFFRVLSRKDQAERLADTRAQLTLEFDEIAAAQRDETD